MASSSNVTVYNKKYDVFISFRGSDFRQGFLSHLHKALIDRRIEAFVDEQLERGKQISESLLGKIKESYISVVVFSPNYAYSEWCLEELLKIAECRNTAGQIVIPVFYGVDPSHVQDLTGSYGDALAQHRAKFDESLVESWGYVLKETASLSGLVSSTFKTESKLIEKIIVHALDKLNCLYSVDPAYDEGLVGIGSRVEKVMSLLRGSEDVCVIGIWGEGGIGKTTLAKATFDQIRTQFDSQCFVGKVREKSDKFTTDAIQNEVVSKLFGTSNSNMTRKRLSRKKVILVLDDVSNLDQIKNIIRYKVDFGYGSRIIVTSRDCHLLKNLGAKIYLVEKLDHNEALQLFCLNSFNKIVPEDGYLELSMRAVKYAQGLPIALVVLGSNLFERCAEEWEDELEKLKDSSDQKIHKILRISYDGLSDVEKEIFLDIACFLKRKWRDEVESLLDVRGSKIGISRLAEKALISISSGNQINMHDLIEQMAKDIICEEKTLEKRRWLWDPEDIYFLLTRDMGTEAVRGISLDMSQIKNIKLSPTAFMKLYNLKYLDFYASRCDKAQVCVPQGLEYFPQQLRYLCWSQFPSKSLPLTSICTEKLVNLDMSYSRLEQLWNGDRNLPNLKKIDLSWSTKLIDLPDLSRASNLELLDLNRCTSLVEIPSLKYLTKLLELRLGYCSRLESLPDNIGNLKSLWRLDVSYCENLHGLPQNFGDLESLKKLWAESSGLKGLPESVCNLKKLRILDVKKCVNLHRLPQNLGNLISLEKLAASESGIKVLPDNICNLKACTLVDVRKCVDLHQLPENIGNLESLQYLRVKGSGIKHVPYSVNNFRELSKLNFYGCKGVILPPLTGDFPDLKRIDLTNCGISEFPIGLCSVTSLVYLKLGGNKFESIPESIQYLLKLKTLALNGCEKMKYLPESIRQLSNLETLDLSQCDKLKYLPESIKLLPQLGDLDLRECTSLDQNQCSKIVDHLIMANVEGSRKEITTVCSPGSEVPETMKHKNECGSCLSLSFQLGFMVVLFWISK